MRTEKERVEEFARKFHDKDVRIRYVLGAFGDIEDCTGIVEEELFPKEGGAFIKYLGCSYLQRGCPLGVIPMELVECYGLAKRILVRAATDLFQNKLFLAYAFLFWFFKRKKFYALLDKYIADICHKTIYVLKFEEKRYNKFPTELRRAMKEAFKKELGEEKFKEIEALSQNYYAGDDKKILLYLPLYRLAELIIFLIDFDTAYKFPVQDALTYFLKDIYVRNIENRTTGSGPLSDYPVSYVERIMDILISRSRHGFDQKAFAIKKTIPWLRFFPPIKRLLYYFFSELKVEEIEMDESDRYWCLRRKLYDFWGMSLEERLKEAKRIDEEKGHVKIKFHIAFSEKDFQEKLGLKKVDNPKENN